MWHAYEAEVQFFFVDIIIDKYNDKLYIHVEEVADVCATPYLVFIVSLINDLTEGVQADAAQQWGQGISL